MKKRLPLLPSHPAASGSHSEMPPCESCTALCCRYFALEIDAPGSADELEDIRWYLLHEGAWVWSDDGKWYLQVDRRCRFLGDDDRCTIYEARPRICREYGLPEYRAKPEDPLCDYFARDEKHEVELREPRDVDAYARRLTREQAAERARRSAAARKGWKKRRARARLVGPRW